jgi:hypothetical protein
VERVKDTVAELRETLSERFNRAAGAPHALFHIMPNGETVKQCDIKGMHPSQMAVYDYLEILKTEARFIDQYHFTSWQKTGDTQSPTMLHN